MPKRNMYFRMATLLPVKLSHGQMPQMSLSMPNGKVATFYADNADPKISNSGAPKLSMQMTTAVRAEWIEVLRQIEDGAYPSGFEPGTPGEFLFDHLPSGLQQLITACRAELMQGLEEAYTLIRWRWVDETLLGARRRRYETFQWSDDRLNWSRVRMRPYISAYSEPQITLSNARRVQAQRLVDEQHHEPLGRDIWHTAVRADSTTAVILSVSAVEVELKRFLADQMPDCRWLLNNMPSPPIVRMLQELVPQTRGYVAQYGFPKQVIDTIRGAVSLRNGYLHVGPPGGSWNGTLNDEKVLAVLCASSDILWLLDVYRGHDWALEFLTTQSLIALGIEPESVHHDFGTLIAQQTGRVNAALDRKLRTFRIKPDV